SLSWLGDYPGVAAAPDPRSTRASWVGASPRKPQARAGPAGVAAAAPRRRYASRGAYPPSSLVGSGAGATNATRDLVSGRVLTARVPAGGQCGRRAAAGEAGAAVRSARSGPWGGSVYLRCPDFCLRLPRRLCRPRHDDRPTPLTLHPRVLIDPRHGIGSL